MKKSRLRKTLSLVIFNTSPLFFGASVCRAYSRSEIATCASFQMESSAVATRRPSRDAGLLAGFGGGVLESFDDELVGRLLAAVDHVAGLGRPGRRRAAHVGVLPAGHLEVRAVLRADGLGLRR